MAKYWDRFRFKIKRHFVEVLQSKNSDHSLAMGYALGTFVSILPTPGFSFFIGLLLVLVFKRINKAMVFIAMAIWNIWTVIPFYWLSLLIGDVIFGEMPVVLFQIEFWNEALQYTRRFLIGNLIVSIPFSVLSYYFALWVLKKVREKRRANATRD
ncbi:DUF2062 domain-containing protein [Reichenbachiella agarivorans]|uniref:DUF2062 domain-containing protein n=1 Tax=Reichenbachiella agarivorans TaxID=2979464 RepID=A0ABY6CPN4_9BACT|nr:DUF2062 domain-containing protein [Reichenbachiella agarivorans]UXP32329.1 DUF2062 domain-containing protein [Reichenbachiella agarivorans]